jgi:hypothetical protein
LKSTDTRVPALEVQSVVELARIVAESASLASEQELMIMRDDLVEAINELAQEVDAAFEIVLGYTPLPEYPRKETMLELQPA